VTTFDVQRPISVLSGGERRLSKNASKVYKTAFWTVCIVILMPLALGARPPLKISSWAYQLQSYDQRTLESLGVDLLVVDTDELDDAGITLESIKTAKTRVVSYLSIGEAEDYRSYWSSFWEANPPAWLGAENPKWKGNFKVRYWHGEWQALMHSAVKRLASRGYDGVYLDLLDAWEYWEPRGVPDARQRMQAFVLSLASTARRVNPNFVVIAQNAPELATSAEYLSAIDAQAIEDLWFDGNVLNSPVDVRWTLSQLEPIVEAGKPVLSIDYVTRFHTVADYCRRGRAHGFIPFTAPRALDAIPTTAHRQCPRPAVRVARQ
jgi:cysteinyl-tRNA synthetase